MSGMIPRMICGLALAAGSLFAQGPLGWEREPIRDIRVRIEGQWVMAGQGRDETAQEVRVKIWGPVLARFSHRVARQSARKVRQYEARAA